LKDIAKLGDSSNFAAWKIKLEVILDDNDVLEYVEGKVPEPLKNALASTKSRYKKGELKVKKILIDSLKDHFFPYVGKLKKSKDIFDKLVGMYVVNNLNHFLSLKKQLKDMKINKVKSMQSYVMRISYLRDQ